MPKDVCPGCGKMITRGRPGKEHSVGEDGKRPCEAKAAAKAAQPNVPPRTEQPTSWGFDDYESLDDLEKSTQEETASDGSAQGFTPGSQAPGSTPAVLPVSLPEMMLLLDPQAFWGRVARFANGFLTHVEADQKIKITAAEAEMLHRTLIGILPAILMNKYGAFILAVAMIFLPPIFLEFAARRKIAAEEKKREKEFARQAERQTGVTPRPLAATA